jgi:gliding motility-associated lipoprotein GldD
MMTPTGSAEKESVKTCRVRKVLRVVLLLACALPFSCRQSYTPKPHAYFRIDFPEREYRMYDGICPFTFEYPVYGTLAPVSEPCLLNVNFPKYRGTLHLTYIEINNNFDLIMEDNFKIIYSRVAQKADAVDDYKIDRPERSMYGRIYDIEGNAASAVQFFVTDSVKHYLRGSLYFSTRPNYDSLAPVVNFFRKDIIHLLETIQWK